MLQQKKIEPDEEFKGPFKRKCIDLAEPLLHDEWNVDWTNGLSSAEIKIVCQHKTWFSNFVLGNICYHEFYHEQESLP
jgi:hypothetical protein